MSSRAALHSILVGDTGGCIPPTRSTMYSSDDVAARLQQRLEASSLAADDPVLAGIILQLGARAEVDPAAGDAWARHWNEQTIAHLQGVDEQSRGLEVARVARE